MNGNDAHPLWTFMKEQTKSGDIQWNYTKFLIDRKGVPRKCFGSLVDPIDFEDDVSAPSLPCTSQNHGSEQETCLALDSW